MTLWFLPLVVLLVAWGLVRAHNRRASSKAVISAEIHLDTNVESLPDRIHLSWCSRRAFPHAQRVGTALMGLRVEGFQGAGTYAIDELQGVCVALAANCRDSMYAVVFDHAEVGVWIDVVSRTLGGKRWTCSTLVGTGLDARPENTRVALPGASVSQVVAQARRDRPSTDLRRVHPRDVAPNFEQGYADWVAWQKSRGARFGLSIVRDPIVPNDGREAA